MVKAIVEAYDSGALNNALKDGEQGFGKWLKALGKETERKGKRLFMPTRVALTGSMHVRPYTPKKICTARTASIRYLHLMIL